MTETPEETSLYCYSKYCDANGYFIAVSSGPNKDRFTLAVEKEEWNRIGLGMRLQFVLAK